MKKYLVIDAGGTAVKYALMNESAKILERGKFPTPGYVDHTLEDFLQRLDVVVEKYQKQIEGIAVSMPGMLDSRKGYCVTGGMLAYFSEVPVVQLLEQRYKLPVTIENDGKCAALAEKWKGSLKDCRNGAVVVLGTGVGGGIIIDHKLYRGGHFTAGEYSYILTDQKRSEEAKGYWGMANGAETLAQKAAFYTGEDPEKLDGIQIFDRANKGEEAVLKALKEFTDTVAVQIYNLNVILDLDVVAIGGGISNQPLLLEYLNRSMNELMEHHPIRKITPYVPKPEITNCKFYNDANLIGALYHYGVLKEGRVEE